MSWELRSKREIEAALDAIWTATSTTAQIGPITPDVADYLRGCRAGLIFTSQALGVDAPTMRLPEVTIEAEIVDIDTRDELDAARAECARLRAELAEIRRAIPSHVDPAAIRAEAETIFIAATSTGTGLSPAAAEFIRIVGQLIRQS